MPSSSSDLRSVVDARLIVDVMRCGSGNSTSPYSLTTTSSEPAATYSSSSPIIVAPRAFQPMTSAREGGSGRRSAAPNRPQLTVAGDPRPRGRLGRALGRHDRAHVDGAGDRAGLLQPRVVLGDRDDLVAVDRR